MQSNSLAGRWVMLELIDTEKATDRARIERTIRSKLGRDAQIFVPIAVTKAPSGQKRKAAKAETAQTTHVLFNGYAFVLYSPRHDYEALREYGVVHGPTVLGGRLATLSAAEVDRMRAQMLAMTRPTIRVGDKVVATTGIYCSIPATVTTVYDDTESAAIEIKLRSITHIVTLPCALLEVVTPAEPDPAPVRPPEPPPAAPEPVAAPEPAQPPAAPLLSPDQRIVAIVEAAAAAVLASLPAAAPARRSSARRGREKPRR